MESLFEGQQRPIVVISKVSGYLHVSEEGDGNLRKTPEASASPDDIFVSRKDICNLDLKQGDFVEAHFYLSKGRKAIRGAFRFDRINETTVVVKPEEVDLKQLTIECIEKLESLVNSSVQLEPLLEDVNPVHTDADRIRRVVFNLLGNAVKFTKQGNITVSLKPVDGWIELSVADTGMGIPPEDLPHIFDAYRHRQVESEAGKPQEGDGLGLAIAMKTVMLLGGAISVESEVGTGTKFSLQIKDYEKRRRN